MSPRLVLASHSPRRRELLAGLGLDFEVVASHVDEQRRPGEAAAAYVERLARAKAEAVAGDGLVVLGADTVVVHGGAILGKPAHPAEAETMLRALSGERHQVLTGVAVATVSGGRVGLESLTEATEVKFFELTDDEIAAYVATGEALDKAGAYALQGMAALFVESITGLPTTVVGLPLPATVRLLRRHGIDPLSPRKAAPDGGTGTEAGGLLPGPD